MDIWSIVMCAYEASLRSQQWAFTATTSVFDFYGKPACILRDFWACLSLLILLNTVVEQMPNCRWVEPRIFPKYGGQGSPERREIGIEQKHASPQRPLLTSTTVKNSVGCWIWSCISKSGKQQAMSLKIVAFKIASEARNMELCLYFS